MGQNNALSEPAWRDLLQDAAGRAARYLEGLDGRGVAPLPEAVAHLTELGGPVPEQPADPQEVLRLLDEIGSPATIATAGTAFFRVRHRRDHPRGSGSKLAGGGLGPECRAGRYVTGRSRARTGSAEAGSLICCTFPRELRADLSPGRPWRTSQPCWLPATRCFPGLAGMWRARACSARRPSGSLPAPKAIRPCSGL